MDAEKLKKSMTGRGWDFKHFATGAEAAEAFGLPSSAFSVSRTENGLEFTVKGSGHGYGLSQNTANEKAKEGWTAEDILAYFYKNVLISE